MDIPPHGVMSGNATHDSISLNRTIIDGVARVVASLQDLSESEEKAAKQQHSFCIQMQDNGRGIHEEHIPRIFDPFFTAKKSALGTGLLIVREALINS